MRTSKLTLLAAALALGMAMGRGHDEAATKNKTFGQRLASWLGCLHTVVIHFPIALIIGAFAVELLGLWRRKPLPRYGTRHAGRRLGRRDDRHRRPGLARGFFHAWRPRPSRVLTSAAAPY